MRRVAGRASSEYKLTLSVFKFPILFPTNRIFRMYITCAAFCYVYPLQIANYPTSYHLFYVHISLFSVHTFFPK